ncbi:response regulator [Methanoregula sp.]|uniref:response regulator n=1 Tax=Methanoregula sp. TaxID=2052170 RepID=UPI002B5E00E1|nr:response regulator [Methanoregula sp.]HVP96790.1 response regulator [Methanoregula sp.]
MHTILVVDDHRAVADVFVEMLEHGGYRTFAAYGGEEGLETLKTVTPDLILLDIMMEPRDGWEVLETIKKDAATASTPVLMLTSKQLTPAEMEKYGDAIEDYVLKPVTDFELFSAIEHVLQRRQAIRSNVDRATREGIDSEIIREYALLVRSIDINKRFLNIFETRYNLNNSFSTSNDSIGQALKNLDATIRVQKTRLQEIEARIR